jgi:hypothetical protein
MAFTFKHELLGPWLAEHAPGDRLVSYITTTTKGIGYSGPAPGSTTSRSTGSPERCDQARSDLADSLGLDEERSVGRGYLDVFHVLTDRQLVIGSISSFRQRPKDVLHAAPLEEVRVHWFDCDSGAGTHFRHFVTVLGDGSWRSDKTGVKAMGKVLKAASRVDEFVAALGDRAIEEDVGY